jgi:aspartate aminotransferase-like enzyme
MNLRIPGPTPLPLEVRQALGKDMIHHRGAGFHALLRGVASQLATFLHTDGDVLLLTASGTGGLEAALVNVLSPGEAVLSLSCGAFGERFADIARAFGGDVHQLDFPWGQSVEVGAVQQALRSRSGFRVLLTTHNETSTGVLNDLEALAVMLRSQGPDRPLWVVDAVSSLGAVDLPMDEWGCDLVVSASQKAWMAPPGMAFVALSNRAWLRIAQARCPRYYWDLELAQKYASRGETPFTPAVSTLYGLRASLAAMSREGLPAIAERHRLLANHIRSGLRELGLRLFAEDAVASPTVTAVYTPDGLAATELRNRLATEHDVVVATGQGVYKESVLRIAHMGFCNHKDIEAVLTALRAVLHR